MALAESYAGLSDQIMSMLWHAITPGLDEAIGLRILAQSMIVNGFLRRSADDASELQTMFDRIYGPR